ncbi:MAG: RNA-guided endonuclease InsQ/TnpB family protein [Candidatus Methanospirareceae archaeon]
MHERGDELRLSFKYTDTCKKIAMKLTIQAGVVGLTRRKKEILDREYSNLQRFLKGDKTVSLYSANKQQALRYYRKVKQKKEYPLSLRNDLINLRRAKAFWFLKIPVHGVRGGIKVPVKPHRDFPQNAKLCESKIVRRKGRYIAMLAFEVSPPPMRKPSSILAVDLGERFCATAVLWCGGVMKVRFYGREIRGIRRHYAWLRRRLQERGLTQVVKRVGSKERRVVNAILHRVSKWIVSFALAANSCIVLGDLTGIRQRAKGKGKRLNRIVSNMPYYRLSKMIEYKAMLRGIPVITTSEAYTSRTCHICGCEGKRKTRGLFVCPHCGEYNADLNGAINIAKKFERALGYMPLAGASCEHALNQPTLEAPSVRVG